MTVEEIKDTYNMEDILSKYGIRTNRNRLISCPFHGKDKHPSMQIFKDGYKCHTCGEAGDIFKFVQKMDNCDFKTAFYSLGGTYERPEKGDLKAQLAQRRAMLERDRQKREKQKLVEEKKQILVDIDFLTDIAEKTALFPRTWCFVMNERERLFDRLDELTERGVNIG